MKNTFFTILISFLLLTSCSNHEVKEINIGFIAPLSIRATDLGIAPSNAIKLAVEEYNNNRKENEPKVNLFIEDGQWNEKLEVEIYNKLRKENNIEFLFISNTDGTVALKDSVLKHNIITINPLNNDKLLSSLNHNVFNIAKSTEEANGLIAIRIIELGLKKVATIHFDNDFMTIGATEVKKILDDFNIKNEISIAKPTKTNFIKELEYYKQNNFDAYVFFGYKEFGFAMKQARELGIKSKFFGSTVLLDPDFFDNSEGTIIGTEFPFFTELDGNYVLVREFINKYKQRFNETPVSVWPPLQAYDAANILLNQIKSINTEKPKNVKTSDYVRNKLININYFQGTCGNIKINLDGSSKGIYFSLYEYKSKENPTVKVIR